MTREQIAKEALARKLKKREEQFDRVWDGIVRDVNGYLEKHEPESDTMHYPRSVDKFIDQLCLSGAWINDRLTGHTSWSGNAYREKILA